MNSPECHRVRTMIDAALDGELGAIDSLWFESHLTTCDTCRALSSERQALVRRVADATRFTAPAALRDRIIAALPPEPRRRVRQPWLTIGGWSASAAALAASLALFLTMPGAHEQLAHDLLSAHLRSLMPEHLTDVPSSDRHTVKPWFNGRLDLSPPVPDLAADGFPLVGGRLDYVMDSNAAALVYRRRQHVINLFAWAESAQANHAPWASAHNGYTVLAWSKGGMGFAAVSDLNPAELAEFQRLWSQRAGE